MTEMVLMISPDGTGESGGPDEAEAWNRLVAEVSRRLHPSVAPADPAALEHLVAEIAEAFREARVQQYLPILIERRVRDALRSGQTVVPLAHTA